jgi:Alternative complex III, ActD subunit
MNHDPLYFGLMAQFDEPEKLVAAARRTREAGYRKIDAYTPFPVEGLGEALQFRRTYISLVVLIGGILGAIIGYALPYYVSVIAYPLNVGGRPYNSWPMFIPIVFEMTILSAGLFAFFGMLALNGLPMPYHPVFNVADFARATQDRFFLVIDASDPKFDREETRKFLETLNPSEVADVPQ